MVHSAGYDANLCPYNANRSGNRVNLQTDKALRIVFG